MPVTRRKRKLSGCEEFEASANADLPVKTQKASDVQNKDTNNGVQGEENIKISVAGGKGANGKKGNVQKKDLGQSECKGKKTTKKHSIETVKSKESKELKESKGKSKETGPPVNKKISNRKGKKNVRLQSTTEKDPAAHGSVNEPSTSSTDIRDKKPRSKGSNSCKTDSKQTDNIDSESSDDDDDFIDVDSSFDDNVEPKPIANLNKKTSKVAGVKTIRKSSTSGKTEAKRKSNKESENRSSRAKQKTVDNDEPPSKARKREKSKSKSSRSSKERLKHEADMNSSLLKEDDVATVLMRMEGQVMAADSQSTNKKSSLEETFCSEEESDWEEVHDHPGSSSVKSQLPSGPVQIRLEVPDIMRKKRKKKSFDWKAYYTRVLNRFKKTLQIQLHKVHLLCLLAHGLHCTRLCSNPILRGQALSLIPTDMLKKKSKTYDLSALSRLTRWFVGLLVVYPEQKKPPLNEDSLMRKFSTKVATEKELVLLYFITLGVLGFDVRLIMALNPIPLKAPHTAKESPKGKGGTGTSKSKRSRDDENEGKTVKAETSEKKRSADKASGDKKSRKGAKASKSGETSSKYFKEEKNAKLKGKSTESAEEQSEERCKNMNKSTDKKGKQSPPENKLSETKNSQSQPSSSRLKAKNSRLRTHASKITSYKECDNSDESDSESKDSDCSNFSEEQRSPQRANAGRRKSGVKTANKTKKTNVKEEILLSSDEFEEDDIVYRSPSYSLKKKYKGKHVPKTVVSSDSDESCLQLKEEKDRDYNLWLEVYLETQRKWICLDAIHNVINKPEMIEKWVKEPMTYVIAFSGDSSIKDVTPRYASKWMSHTRKLQVDSEWWLETLEPYRSSNSKREEFEDLLLKAQLLEKPMPHSIGEFKNHPLYALERHLLKFEAIYPETAVPLDFIRKEPIYARECVHTLHSRDNWLKEGRVVKQGETAYKMVKSRPKWNKPKENPDELDLELFGEWQSEIYVPPPAKDGKIHKNEYGNIELFKPSMLPEGTVHIRIEGLKRIAKKLDIDCVPAMVGWDHHSGFAHPILDGFVVCKEHEDLLLSAWEEDQEFQRQREFDKRHKRVYGNWKILVRGLLIRERLKKRFDLETVVDEKTKKGKEDKGEKATDTEMSWPRNRQRKPKGKKSETNSCLVEVEKL